MFSERENDLKGSKDGAGETKLWTLATDEMGTTCEDGPRGYRTLLTIKKPLRGYLRSQTKGRFCWDEN